MTDKENKDMISFQEHLDKLLAEWKEKGKLYWDGHKREHELLADRLTGQATEYARRLEDLNHEAAQLKDMHQKYLLTDVYNAHHKEHTGVVDCLSKLVRELEIAQKSIDIRLTTIESSVQWLTRLIEGAVILGVLGYLAQHLLR
jgi:hypothetical protein